VRNYDWWNEIEDKIEDRLAQEVQSKIDEKIHSPEFRNVVKGIVAEYLAEKVAAYKLALKNVVFAPFRKIRALVVKAKCKVRKWFGR
jgi:hypothetical protein